MESKFMKYLPKKNQWLIVLLVGILLVVIALPTKSSSNSGLEIEYEESNENATEEEKRLESILSNMQNVGDVHVMITYQEDDKVQGVVVIAEGGGNAVVVQNIMEVVQALFSVDSHKIKVIESN